MKRRSASHAFTLLEVLTALFILSVLALMSYRALATALDTRERVQSEADKWRHVAAFFTRFESDIRLAAPRPMRDGERDLPAWSGDSRTRLDFARFASPAATDIVRRVSYVLNDRRQIELWLWAAADLAPATPARYPVLDGVAGLELRYLSARMIWVSSWPSSAQEPALPRAIEVRIALASGEEIVRVFAL